MCKSKEFKIKIKINTWKRIVRHVGHLPRTVMRNVRYGIAQNSVCSINSACERLQRTVYGALVCGDFSDTIVRWVADLISAGVHVFLFATQLSFLHFH